MQHVNTKQHDAKVNTAGYYPGKHEAHQLSQYTFQFTRFTLEDEYFIGDERKKHRNDPRDDIGRRCRHARHAFAQPKYGDVDECGQAAEYQVEYDRFIFLV